MVHLFHFDTDLAYRKFLRLLNDGKIHFTLGTPWLVLSQDEIGQILV